MAKAWLVKVAEKNLLGVIKEPILNFMEVADSRLKEDRLNQARQTVKKFLYSIFDAIHAESQAPNKQLLTFIDSIS
jgi:hypothetical protein